MVGVFRDRCNGMVGKVKTVKWADLKEQALDERHGRCEVVRDGIRCNRAATQAHHVFISNVKRYREEANTIRNLQLVCSECHGTDGTKGLPKDNKRTFWVIQAYRYDDMMEWWDTLPPTRKERFW